MRVRLALGVVLASCSMAIGGQPAISDAAREQIDRMCQAHRSVGSMTVSGTISGDFNVAGVEQKEARNFTTTYLAPGLFAHDVKDELLVGSDGKQVYALSKPSRQYVRGDVPPTGMSFAEMPANIRQMVSSQDPSLALVLSRDPKTELMENVVAADIAAEQSIDGKAFPTVRLSLLDNRGTVTFAIDPATSLPRRVVYDVSQTIERQNIGAVKSATITVDYAMRSLGVAVPAEAFAFDPPAGAQLVTATGKTADMGDPQASGIKEGQPAPDFDLSTPDGKVVRLSDLKGSVVVLDFWATWCGPCVASLPDLQAMNDELSKEGVKVFAVNEQEESAKVQGFLAKRKITVPVLLDTEGKVGGLYGASAIPYKVVIDKGGIVRLLKVGYEQGERAGLTAQIRELLAK